MKKKMSAFKCYSNGIEIHNLHFVCVVSLPAKIYAKSHSLGRTSAGIKLWNDLALHVTKSRK